MTFLGRLIGKDRPILPPGGRAFVAMSTDEPPVWTVRVALPGEDEATDRPRVPRSPVFTSLVNADAWAAWANGGPVFRYPAGRA